MESIAGINDLDPVADQLALLLRRDYNADIALEFPNLVANLTGRTDIARRTIHAMRSEYKLGVHELFIVSLGAQAVGLSVATTMVGAPEGIDASTPNLSGFICAPYRGIGLGKESLRKRLEVVEDDFHSHAWTSVGVDNVISNHLVKSVGFKLHAIDGNRNVYTYEP